MPKVVIRKPPDKRNLVDRLLDRIRNNRVAAVAIVLCIGLGGVASFTDSVRKLGDALPSFSAPAKLGGQWKSEAAIFRPDVGSESLRLYLQEAAADQVVGTIQFNGAGDIAPRAFPIVQGRRSGKSVLLSLGGDANSLTTISGELAGEEFRFVYQHANRGAVAATARRIDQAAQLVDGHVAIVYKHQEYPDHRSACTRMLQELDPPQAYKASEPPTAYGDVRCVGQAADGSGGFDQYQNDVQQQLVCPPHARVALIDGQARPASTRGCECDGTLAASAGRCVAPA